MPIQRRPRSIRSSAEPQQAPTVEHCERPECNALLESSLYRHYSPVLRRIPDDLARYTTHHVCDNCFQAHTFECWVCYNRYFTTNGIETLGGGLVCQYCAEYRCRACDECDGLTHGEYIHSHNGNALCRDCYDTVRNGPGYIHDYGYRPRPVFFGDGPIYFGVELEVEVVGRARLRNYDDDTMDFGEQARVTGEALRGFAYLKSDGSLSNGFEIVTHPATLAEHKKRWTPFFDKRPSALRSFATSTCGLHVHVTKAPLSQLTIGKMLVFTNHPRNREFVETMAQRSSGQWAQYYQKKLSDGRKINPARYEAINLIPRRTLEFRIFKGTLNRLSFFKSLEFCAALTEFCSPAERSLSEAISHTEFIKHVGRQQKLYPNLWAFVDREWLKPNHIDPKSLGIKVPTIPIKSELGLRIPTRPTHPKDSVTAD